MKEGNPMSTISLLKKNVNGVEKSFLMKKEEIIESDFEEETLYFLSKSIPFLIESCAESNKDLLKVFITADKYFFIFFHKEYILGVVASREANIPLLEMISKKLLFNVEETPEKTEEAVDEVLQKMKSFLR
jgi:hypothetical protein